ncbi:hypothetical protein LTR53_012812, partial [Teratosphaeriaceae sp. CCFEE 6253]
MAEREVFCAWERDQPRPRLGLLLLIRGQVLRSYQARLEGQDREFHPSVGSEYHLATSSQQQRLHLVLALASILSDNRACWLELQLSLGHINVVSRWWNITSRRGHSREQEKMKHLVESLVDCSC